MGRLDFVYVSGDANRQSFGSAQKLLVLGEISVPVSRREHLAAMKILAMKNDPERTFREMADIVALREARRDRIKISRPSSNFFQASRSLPRLN